MKELQKTQNVALRYIDKILIYFKLTLILSLSQTLIFEFLEVFMSFIKL